MNIQPHTIRALRWIMDIIQSTPDKTWHRISGGFAANLHGTTRELADIDIDLTSQGFETITSLIPSNYFIYGPERYKDKHGLPTGNLRI
jgi:hypothetical protein